MKKIILLISFSISVIFSTAQVPAWSWAKSAGGDNNENTFSITADVKGNTYVTGEFSSHSITFGTTKLINDVDSTTNDIFVVKYDVSGNVKWAESAGGRYNDRAASITTDASGSSYVTGYFDSPSITFGSTTLINDTTSGTADMFIVKYDSSGSVLWAKSARGKRDDNAYSITHDTSGNCYVTGQFSSDTIFFGSVALINSDTSADIFIAKYDKNGNVAWAKSAGGSDYDVANTITADNLNNIYIAGEYYSSSITFGSTTLTNTVSGKSDVFVAKYDSSGTVQWAKSAGGSGFEDAISIATDNLDNVYVTGVFDSPSITVGSTTLVNGGIANVFLIKYNVGGNVGWAKNAGGSGFDVGNSVTTDALGNSYIAGNFDSPSITFGSTTLNNSGVANIFLAKYDTAGIALWATGATGSDYDDANSITSDGSGNIYLTGDFGSDSISFGTTTLTNDTTSGADIYIAKLASSVTGVNQLTDNNQQFSIYPNPSTGQFAYNLSADNINSTIEVYNIMGEQVFSTQSISGQINLNDQVPGTYLVYLKSERNTTVKKIMIVR